MISENGRFREAGIANFINTAYYKFGIFTLIVIFLVILAGGVVRMAGAGMGCPEWPKCFGRWIPPTTEAELPTDYQIKYAVNGHVIEKFNVVKTWTEYVNRLLGALSGVFVFITFLLSLGQIRAKKYHIIVSTFIVLLFMGAQGLLGAKVVSSNLLPAMVTVHMLFAIIIVFALTYALFGDQLMSVPLPKEQIKQLWLPLLVLFFGVLAQILLGTAVRERIDVISFQNPPPIRESWIENIGLPFYLHRSFSLLIAGIYLWTFRKLRRIPVSDIFGKLFRAVGLSLGLEILAGIILAYFALPPIFQPIHLLISTILITLLFVLLMIIAGNLKQQKRQRHPTIQMSSEGL